MTCESVQLLHEMVWYWKMPATQDRWLRAPLGPRGPLPPLPGGRFTHHSDADSRCGLWGQEHRAPSEQAQLVPAPPTLSGLSTALTLASGT